ncbi:MAG: hypothetical protein K2X11_21565 [Acetobacteraceae bacterium]|nr:hypothetical protein [Acetobacteraceae bacterium]
MIRIAALPVVLLAAACAGGPAPQQPSAAAALAIVSDPAGAACEVRRQGSLLASVPSTPAEVQVTRSMHDIVVTCERAGHQAASHTLSPRVTGEQQALMAGALLGGGVAGLIGMAMSGALAGDYEPAVSLILVPSHLTTAEQRANWFAERRQALAQQKQEELAALRTRCAATPGPACEEEIARAQTRMETALRGLDQQRATVAGS